MDMAPKGEINPEDLPPMERTYGESSSPAKQLNDVRLDPLHWGWKQDATCFTPVQADNDVRAEVMKLSDAITTTCATVCYVPVKNMVEIVLLLVDNAKEKFVKIQVIAEISF